MIALLRRDGRWLSVLSCMGMVALVGSLFADSFADTWVLPQHHFEGLFHAAWICGAVLGAVAALWDELLGTREYVRHRAVAPARILRARLLGTVLVLLVWILLAPPANYALGALPSRAGGLGSLARLPEMWATMTPAFSACAIVFFAGTLPCTPLLRLAVAAAGFHAAFALADALVRPQPGSPVAFAAAHLGAALLFAAAAGVGAGAVADPDRPWPAAVRRWRGGLAALCLALSVALLWSVPIQAALEARIGAGPAIVQHDGRYGLAVASIVDGRRHWWPVDREHRVHGPELPRDALRTVWQGFHLGHTRDPGFDVPRFGEVHWLGGRHQLADGRLHVLRGERDPTLLVLGRDASGAPFSPRARGQRVEVDADGREVEYWIVEPGAAVVWRLTGDREEFEQVPLPGGDRVVGQRTAFLRGAEGLAAEDLARYLTRRDTLETVIGERGVYRMREGRLVPAEDAVIAGLAGTTPDSASRPRVEVVDNDPLAPHVRVVQPAGAAADGATVLFEHRFGARTGSERLHSALALLLAALQPLPLQALASAMPAGRSGMALSDPLLRGGRRPWLLLLVAAVSGLCAWAARRRLRRLGAPAQVATFWFVATALLGPTGLATSLLVETRRAWTRLPPGTAPPPRIAAGGGRTAARPAAP